MVLVAPRKEKAKIWNPLKFRTFSGFSFWPSSQKTAILWSWIFSIWWFSRVSWKKPPNVAYFPLFQRFEQIIFRGKNLFLPSWLKEEWKVWENPKDEKSARLSPWNKGESNRRYKKDSPVVFPVSREKSHRISHFFIFLPPSNWRNNWMYNHLKNE